jgi:hypothetical protein
MIGLELGTKTYLLTYYADSRRAGGAAINALVQH